MNHITKQYRSPDATHLRLLAGELETRRTGLALALLLLGSRRTLALTLALGSVNASLLGLAGTALGFRRDSVGSLAFDLGAGRLLTLLREPAAGLLQDPSDVDLPSELGCSPKHSSDSARTHPRRPLLLGLALGRSGLSLCGSGLSLLGSLSSLLSGLGSLGLLALLVRGVAALRDLLLGPRQLEKNLAAVKLCSYRSARASVSAQQRCVSSEPDSPWSLSCSTAFLASASSLYDAKAYPAGRLPKRRGRATDRLI